MIEEQNKILIEMQAEQLKLFAEMRDAWKLLADRQETPVQRPSESLEQFVQKQANSGVWELGIPRVPNNVSIEVGTKTTVSPKLDFAIQWLKAHPEDKEKSGRDLENTVLMDGETISYKWWNKAKNEV